MAKKVRPVPKGFTTVTPQLSVKDANAALAFYKKAFGAKVLGKMLAPDKKVMHADLQIGDARVFVAEPMMGNTPGAASLHLYVENAEKAWKKAAGSGPSSPSPSPPPSDPR
jgi:PhnB protein